VRYFDIRTIYFAKSCYILVQTLRLLVTVCVGLMVCFYKYHVVRTMFSLVVCNYFKAKPCPFWTAVTPRSLGISLLVDGVN